MPNLPVKRIHIERSSHSTTASTAEKLASFKRTHLKQNNDLIRANTIYASYIRKLENETCALKSENLELRARLIHVERQLELKKEQCIMLTEPLEDIEQREKQVGVAGSSSSSSSGSMTMTFGGSTLSKTQTQQRLVSDDGTKQSCIVKEKVMHTTTPSINAMNSNNKSQLQQLPSPSPTSPKEEQTPMIKLHKYSDEKDDIQQLLSPPSTENSITTDENMTMTIATTIDQTELLEDCSNHTDSDEEKMGYSIEPPFSPDIELLLEHQKEHDMNHSEKHDNHKKVEQQKPLPSPLIDTGKQNEASEQQQQPALNNMQDMMTPITTSASPIISGSKRSKAPVCYTLPSVKKKLRKGDPFTFDYQRTTT